MTQTDIDEMRMRILRSKMYREEEKARRKLAPGRCFRGMWWMARLNRATKGKETDIEFLCRKGVEWC